MAMNAAQERPEPESEETPATAADIRRWRQYLADERAEAAVYRDLASQPDVLAKIRDGKVQAAGAVIGAGMKAMRGQADAARVRELVLERAGTAAE